MPLNVVQNAAVNNPQLQSQIPTPPHAPQYIADAFARALASGPAVLSLQLVISGRDDESEEMTTMSVSVTHLSHFLTRSVGIVWRVGALNLA